MNINRAFYQTSQFPELLTAVASKDFLFIKIPILFFLFSLITSCQPEKSNALLKEGIWRGEFILSGEIAPVTFEVSLDSANETAIDFINGGERIRFGGASIKNDSLLIPFDIFDSYIIASVEDNYLTGYYKRNTTTIPFHAACGKEYRFELTSAVPVSNISGTWNVSLTSEGSDPEETVGVFEQQENNLTGTIMTVTGDYRFFDGKADGENIYLSSFIGSSPKLIRARILNDSTLEGTYFSGTAKSTIKAKRNANAKLPDPYQLTYLKDTTQLLDFTFPDLNGNTVSLHDKKYEGKVKIITITGSWCPNCLDEASFLAPWYEENRNRGIEIIALSFERKDDFAYAKEKIESFIRRFNIQYDVLFAGKADKKEAAAKLPQLNAVLSYPTIIFVDAKGRVRKIHTGFNGPATGKFYDEFIHEFNTIVDLLVEEKNESV